MTTTSKLGLYLLANAAANQTLANSTFAILNQLVQAIAEDKDLTAPPGSPTDEQMYIVAATATGAWAGKEKQLAYWLTAVNQWSFIVPREGFRVRVNDENAFYYYDGTAWAVEASGGGGGMTNPMTTTGDIIYASGSGGTPARLAAGANTQVLTLAGGIPTWAAPASGGMTNPMTAALDLIVGGTSGAPQRLAGPGTTGHVLTYNGTALVWAAPSGGGGSGVKPVVDLQNSSDITLDITAANAYCLVGSSFANIVTVPLESAVAWPAGCEIYMQTSDASLTVNGASGVTVAQTTGLTRTITKKNTVIKLKKIGTNSWTMDYSNGVNVFTNAGDMMYANPASATRDPVRLAIGTSGQVLTCVSDGFGGFRPGWAVGGMLNPMTAVGDLIVGGTSGAGTRLAASSTAGQVLTWNGTAIVWATPSGGGGSSQKTVVTESGTVINTALTHDNNFILTSNASAVSVYLYADSTTGWATTGPEIAVCQNGAGKVSFLTGGAATFVVPANKSAAISGRGGVVYIKKIAANTWSLTGDLRDNELLVSAASASTMNLNNLQANVFNVTGTTTITAIGADAIGMEYTFIFAGVLVLTHGASSLILPGGANITTAAGDVMRMIYIGSSTWRCTSYMRAAIAP